MTQPSQHLRGEHADAVLIGAGIASATLAALLSELEPNWRIVVVERLAGVGYESSDGWNNAGTGHSALCELNYTPQDVDGAVNPSKAVQINEHFQFSRELWAQLVREGKLGDPRTFIRSVPHMSFVRGTEHVDFLKRRFEALSEHPLFHRMEFSTDHAQIGEWAPLITEDRPLTQSVAATRSGDGTDVDFGALSRALLAYASTVNTEVITGAHVVDIRRMGREWGVLAEHHGSALAVKAPFVFVGAGGGALPLLQRSNIPEIRGYGGFPISGQWLRCTNPAIVTQHMAKVYGKAAVGAPPMSVPHLDTRIINGQRELMFGPYAGWSPKFLKNGSVADLPRSVKPSNVLQMLAVGPPNLDLVTYLVAELAKGHRQRVAALREYMPSAHEDDWELVHAGQRVQVIAPVARRSAVLQFGTELITSADGSIAGMLGASPGASTAVEIMMRLLTRTHLDAHPSWINRMKELVPSWGSNLSHHPERAHESLRASADALGLTY